MGVSRVEDVWCSELGWRLNRETCPSHLDHFEREQKVLRTRKHNGKTNVISSVDDWGKISYSIWTSNKSCYVIARSCLQNVLLPL